MTLEKALKTKGNTAILTLNTKNIAHEHFIQLA